MLVLVRVRGYVDPLLDLWPYITGFRVLPSGCLLSLDVHDSRELVSVLVALASRGVEIEEVHSPEHSQQAARQGRDHFRRVTSAGSVECDRDS
jgi:predicted nuclease with RNAse H fold